MKANASTKSKLFFLIFISVCLCISVFSFIHQTQAQVQNKNGWYYVFVKPDAYYKIQGSSVSFSGKHFIPNELVVIVEKGVTKATTTADILGNFITNPLTVPYEIGKHTYIFKGALSRIAFPVRINVRSGSAWIVLNTYFAPASTSITISGHQFGAHENVLITFGGANGGTTSTDDQGAFTFTTVVPAQSTNRVNVNATGLTTHLTTHQVFSFAH
jgi:hypothetical protein